MLKSIRLIFKAKVACTFQSLAFNFDMTCSREVETNDSMIIILFSHTARECSHHATNNLMIIILFPSLSNQSIVNQNYFENEDLVSTGDFRVQSTVS